MRALHEPAYREAARRSAQELAERPGMGEAVALLESYAA
jgi:UDP:flavonoid glycosyltransferase YjiC (YdhE family)